jgi:two-component sensor histidine kinase
MARLILDRHWVLDAILHQIPKGILVAEGPDVELRYISDHAIRMTGRPVTELQALRGDQIVERWHFLAPRSRHLLPRDELPLVRAASGDVIDHVEILLERADGTILTILCKAAPIRDPDGKIAGSMMAWTDMTEESRLRHQLQEALSERETLMAEINHGLRRTMSLVASVIGIHMAKAQSEDVKGMLRAVRGRVIATARIHEQLYMGGFGRTVEFGEFLLRLCHDLETVAATEGRNVRCRAIAAPYYLPIAQAIPLALAVNELATNALKHAYPEGSGEIRIEFAAKPGGETRITVADTGIGLPEGFDPKRSADLGLQIVNRLIEQIGAQLHVERTNPGARFAITLPTPGATA